MSYMVNQPDYKPRRDQYIYNFNKQESSFTELTNLKHLETKCCDWLYLQPSICETREV